jgi:hypothetical protein
MCMCMFMCSIWNNRDIASMYGDGVIDLYSASKQLLEFTLLNSSSLSSTASSTLPVAHRTQIHHDSLHYCDGGVFRAGILLLQVWHFAALLHTCTHVHMHVHILVHVHKLPWSHKWSIFCRFNYVAYGICIWYMLYVYGICICMWYMCMFCCCSFCFSGHVLTSSHFYSEFAIYNMYTGSTSLR